MLITVSVSSHAWKNGSQSTRVDRRQAEVRRDLAERDRTHAAFGVAADLRGGELAVPQRDDDQGDQATARVAAPLLDHPVVVRATHASAEVVVLALQERLPAEAGERREAQRRLDPVVVHVGEARLGFVAARVASRRSSWRAASSRPAGSRLQRTCAGGPSRDDPRRSSSRPASPRRPTSRRTRPPPTGRSPALYRRSMRGPSARCCSGSQVCQRCAGSTTWSSTLTIFGSSRSIGSPFGRLSLLRRGHYLSAAEPSRAFAMGWPDARAAGSRKVNAGPVFAQRSAR